MTCLICQGSMEVDTASHFADTGSCSIIIKNVPCNKCTQCGEVVFSLTVGKRLEQIISTLKNSFAEVAVVQYSNDVA